VKLIRVLISSIIKLEPHDDKSNDVEIIVDEPEVIIKTETPEPPPTAHTPTLKQQSRPNSQPNQHHRQPNSPISLQQQLRQPQLLLHEISSPPPPLIDNGPNHCKTCDIKFNYVNTFLAHKKFYCKSIPNDVGGLNELSSPPPAAATTNVRVTETTVL
jgi:zinc finger protein ZFPM1